MAHDSPPGPAHSRFSVNNATVVPSATRRGVASGMKHVETNTYDVKRLLHVKEEKHPGHRGESCPLSVLGLRPSAWHSGIPSA